MDILLSSAHRCTYRVMLIFMFDCSVDGPMRCTRPQGTASENSSLGPRFFVLLTRARFRGTMTGVLLSRRITSWLVSIICPESRRRGRARRMCFAVLFMAHILGAFDLLV